MNNMNNDEKLTTLYANWIAAKQSEQTALEWRREIEDTLAEMLKLSPDHEGTETVKHDSYAVKIVGRLNRKVDGDLLQELAAQEGIEAVLPILFRWKPEINVAAWKNAAENITGKLAGAITTTPGRPSFSITKKEEK